ncbi:MAG: MFS transporter [Desulfobacterales bacterium]|nr:MAG: MFS transporter [Desulfobacterales bacterium]
MLTFPIAAIPLGGMFVAVLGIIADLADYDQLKFGQRRESIYYGIYGIVRKTGWTLCSLILAEVFPLSFTVPKASQDESRQLHFFTFPPFSKNNVRSSCMGFRLAPASTTVPPTKLTAALLFFLFEAYLRSAGPATTGTLI